MRYRYIKIICLTLMIAGTGTITAHASMDLETDASVSGIAVALNNYYARSAEPSTALSQSVQRVANGTIVVDTTTPQSAAQKLVQEAETAAPAVAQSSYQDIAISQVSGSVNIRTEPNTTSQATGKISNNAAATILDTVDGEGGKWYKIQSGNVTGYIKAEYFTTGSEAEQKAMEVGTTYGTVQNTSSLRLRQSPATDAPTLTLLAQGASYVVLGQEGDFLKIQVDDDLTGYVFKDYVSTSVQFDKAISDADEAAKKAEEDKLKAEADAAMAELEKAKKQAAESSEAETTAKETTAKETTAKETTAKETTAKETTAKETTAKETTAKETTAKETTAKETTSGAKIEAPTTKAETTKSTSEQTVAAIDGTVTDAPTGAIAQTKAPETTKADETTKAPETTKSQETVKAPETTTAAKTTTAETAKGPSTSGPGGEAVVSATRSAIVAYSKQFLGNPYVFGGTSLTDGADCSGFTMQVYAHFGYSIGRSSRDQAAGGRTISTSEMKPGDLLFYASGDYINHVAMYVGNGQVIHASSTTTGIILSPSNYRTPCKVISILD